MSKCFVRNVKQPLKANNPYGEKGDCMTAITAKKVVMLVRITRKNMSNARKVRGEKAPSSSPFVGSAAKYYPALRKLATK